MSEFEKTYSLEKRMDAIGDAKDLEGSLYGALDVQTGNIMKKGPDNLQLEKSNR